MGWDNTGHTHTESDVTDLDHTDTDAIHDNVAGEIAAVTEKAGPVDADWVLIEDSEASNAKKRAQLGNLPGGSGGGGGGASELPAWAQDNVSASQTDVALTLLGNGRETVRVLADGELTAVLLESTEARTAGTCTVTVQVNGSDTALTATLDGTNTDWHAGSGTVAVSQGDEVGVVVTTDGSWAPTTAEITVRVQVGTSGGSSSGLVLIEEQILASTASAITFSSIPAAYTDLMLVLQLRSDRASTNDDILFYVGNGTVDTGSNYRETLRFEGASSGNVQSAGRAGIRLAVATSGANAAAGVRGAGELKILEYTSSRWKDMTGTGGVHNNDVNGFWVWTLGIGEWMDSDPIDIIEIVPSLGTNWVAGSRAVLYGLG